MAGQSAKMGPVLRGEISNTQSRPLNGHPPSIYTIVACAFKWKSSAARSAFNLTAETQGLSSKVHSIGTTEPMRPGGTSAQTSRFI